MDPDKVFSKKNIISYLLIAVLAVSIPVAVNLSQQRQTFESRAAEPKIEFKGEKSGDVVCDPAAGVNEVSCTAKSSTIRVELTAPWPPQTGGTQ